MTQKQDRYEAYDTISGKYSIRKVPKWNARQYQWNELTEDRPEEEKLSRAANDY